MRLSARRGSDAASPCAAVSRPLIVAVRRPIEVSVREECSAALGSLRNKCIKPNQLPVKILPDETSFAVQRRYWRAFRRQNTHTHSGNKKFRRTLITRQ